MFITIFPQGLTNRSLLFNVRMIVQGTREINITVGISESEYEKAVHAVHGEFFPEAPQ